VTVIIASDARPFFGMTRARSLGKAGRREAPYVILFLCKPIHDIEITRKRANPTFRCDRHSSDGENLLFGKVLTKPREWEGCKRGRCFPTDDDTARQFRRNVARRRPKLRSGFNPYPREALVSHTHGHGARLKRNPYVAVHKDAWPRVDAYALANRYFTLKAEERNSRRCDRGCPESLQKLRRQSRTGMQGRLGNQGGSND